MKHRKISLVLGILLLLPLFSFAFVPNVAAYTVTVDGDPSDWLADTSGQADNTRAYYTSYMPCGSEYVWKDEAGDDTGNGTYTYPTNATAYPRGIVDMLEFRVTSDLNNLYMLFKMGDVVNPEPADVDGFKNIVIIVMIDTDNVFDSGEEWGAQDSRIKVRGELAWEYQVVIKANATGWSSPWFGSFIANSTWNAGGWYDWYCFGHKSVTAKGSTVTDYIEVAVPLSFTDDTGQSYSIDIMDAELKFVVAAGFCDWSVGGYDGSPNSGNMLGVEDVAGPLNPGGGSTADWADPDVMDMLFYGTKAAQEADLNGWTTGNPMYVGGVSYCQGYEMIYFSSSTPPCPYAKIHLVDSTDWTKWDLSPEWVMGSLVGYKPGDSFTVDVIIENVTDLYAWDIGAVWDPAILTCNSIKEGTFLSSTGYATSVLFPGTINPGSISPPMGVTLLGAPKGQNGSSTDAGKGALATLNFTIASPLAYCKGTWINLTIVPWDSRGKPITMPINDAYWHHPFPPPEGPVAKIGQSPAPYWVDEGIDLWSESTGGWNGTHAIHLNNCTWTIRFSNGSNVPGYPVTIDCQAFPGCPITFTPPIEDVYTIILEVRTKPDAVLDSKDMNYDMAETTKEAAIKALVWIDCYTNKDRRCGYDAYSVGAGPNLPADAYMLDELVTLYAWVVYKNNPMQHRLVSFEIYSPIGLFFVEQNMTDDYGVAYIKFRIPTACDDYTKYIGKWYCFQKVLLCDEYYNDTVEWDVGWIIELQSVQILNATHDPVEKIDMNESFAVLIELKNIAMAPRDILIAVKVLDDNLVPVVFFNFTITIDPGDFCEPYHVWIKIWPFYFPKWTYPGTGRMIADAWFHTLPSGCGHCCCPPVTDIFVITAPEPQHPDP